MIDSRLLSLLLATLAIVAVVALAESSDTQQPQRTLTLLAASASSPHSFPLIGCPSTGYTMHVSLSNGGTFPLLLSTVLSAMIVSDARVQCTGCSLVHPKWNLAALPKLADVESLSAEGTHWSGGVYSAHAATINSAHGSPSLTLSALPIAAIDSITQSGNGAFFRPGTCSDPANKNTVTYAGFVGLARSGGVDTAAVGVPSVTSTTAGKSAVGEVWSSILTATHTTSPLSNEFTLSLCAEFGSLSVGAPSTSLEHAQFRSRFTGSMRYAKMHRSWTGLYALEMESITIQRGNTTAAMDAAPSNSTTIVPLAPNLLSIVDASSPHLVFPSLIFLSIQSALVASPQFAQAFPALVDSEASWWFDGVCTEVAEGWTVAQLYTQLPRLIFSTRDGLRLSVGSVGSYLVPCGGDAHASATTSWKCGIALANPEVSAWQNRLQLGWAFLNHFMVTFDVGQGYLGFAPSAACGNQTQGAWDGNGSSGASVEGGLPGACGTGATSALISVNASVDCAPRAISQSPTHCSPLTLSPEELAQGWTLGDCEHTVAKGSQCHAGCAEGFATEFSRAFWCDSVEETAEGSVPASVAFNHGHQRCTPLQWNVIRPFPKSPPLHLPAAFPLQVDSDEQVEVDWILPPAASIASPTSAAVPAAAALMFSISLQWVASDSGSQSNFTSPMVLLSPTPVALSNLTATRSLEPLQFRAPNVTSATVFRLRGAWDGVDWGSEVMIQVAPAPLTPLIPLPPSSSGAAAASSSAAAAYSSSAQSVSSSAAAAAPPQAAPSSSAASELSSTSVASTVFSSTGSSPSLPVLDGVSVLLDSSLSFETVSADRTKYFSALRRELESSIALPSARVADVRVASHVDPAITSTVAAAAETAPHARFSFVILPAAAGAPASEPTADSLRAALLAAFLDAQSPFHSSSTLVTSAVTHVDATLIAACANDGGYQTDCAEKPVAEEGLEASPDATVDKGWMYAVVVVAALASVILCCCLLLRGRSSASHATVASTSAVPSSRKSKSKSGRKLPSSNNNTPAASAAAGASRKHQGERFTIIDNNHDEDDDDAFEDEEEELEMEELPTNDRLGLGFEADVEATAGAVDIREPSVSSASSSSSSAAASRVVRPLSPPSRVSLGGHAARMLSPPKQTLSRIAPPPAAASETPDFEMDAASDDDELQL